VRVIGEAAAVGPARPRLTLPILIVIGALGAIGPVGTDMYLPALPTMASQLTTTAAWTQLTLTAFSVGLALGQLLLGTLSDRLGRRRLLLGGMALLVISAMLCATAPTVQLLILWRIVMGISGAAGIVIGRAIAADLTSGAAAARVFSLLGLIAGIGPILGPLFGGLVLGWAGWRAIFWAILVFAILLLAGTLSLIPETLPQSARHTGGFREFLRTATGILTRRRFLGYALAFWFGFGTMFAYISASPFVVQRILGFSPGQFTLVFACNAVGIVIAGSLSAWLVGRVKASTLAAIGLTAQLVASLTLVTAALTASTQPVIILPALFLITTGAGFIMGNCTALAVAGIGARGTAMALLGCVQFLVAGTVAPLVGLAGETSLVPLAVVTLSCVLIALCGLGYGRAHHSELD
jgi:DHA1 family bicyclomycin/chloramphenicol resistance-like MFS transporter